MKEIKTSTVFLMIVVLFVVFCTGIFVGKQSRSDEFTIKTANAMAVRATEAYTAQSTQQAQSESTTHSEPATTVVGKVNINTASVSELTTLPGIGETIAQRIVDYRETYGAFTSVMDLDMVKGIGEKKLAEIIDFITVEDNNEDTGS